MAPAEPDPREPLEADGVPADLEADILESIPEPAAREAALRAATITEFRAPAQAASRAATAVAVEPAPPASEPEWKRQVASKLEEYRSRRQRSGDDPQNDLPFAQNHAPPQPDPRASLRYAARSRPQERVDISAQPALDFDASQSLPQPGARLVPVARWGDRVHAGLLDAGFLTIVYGGFLLMFHWLGSAPISFGRVDALVYAVTCFLVCAQYFALFTIFGGSTPGMMLRGLHAVSFDGNPPSSQQLMWRSFGYLVSGAAALLGFAWALWDEDQLTWHDRISQTYLTAAPQHPSSADFTSSPPLDPSAQSWKLF
ncbi:MAG: RDD family protein [Candidatus Acidiferrales bacterium]